MSNNASFQSNIYIYIYIYANAIINFTISSQMQHDYDWCIIKMILIVVSCKSNVTLITICEIFW